MGWLCVNTLTFIEITCQLQVSEFSFLSLHLLLSITSWARWFKFTEPHVLSCGPSHVVAFLKAEGRESGSGCPEWLSISVIIKQYNAPLQTLAYVTAETWLTFSAEESIT